MRSEQRGKHARRRAWLRREWDQCVDAAYTPVGQRALGLLIVAAVVLASNLTWFVFLLIWSQ